MPLAARLLSALALSLLVHGACREVGPALGPTPAEARRVADELLGTLARAFGPHRREADLLAFRARVSQAWFAPSRMFDDTAAWPEADRDTRSAAYTGAAPAAGPYHLELRRDPRPASTPGDYRAGLSLRKLGEGEFVWRLHEELALGHLRLPAAAESLTRALRAMEQAPPAHAAGALRAAFPRTARALGRLASLERVDLSPHAQGGTVLLLGARMRTATLAGAGFPAYTRFLDRYVVPLRLRITAADAGATLWQLDVHEGRLLLNLRSRDGGLVPLSGAPRGFPDACRLTIDFSTPAGLFRVGVSGLEADLRLVREAREKALDARFRREPEWRLPFVVRPFLRASLRRPFEGDGARLHLGLREAPGGHALLVREYDLAVRESWLVRWLGGLGTNAVAAFRLDAEEQAERFHFEVLDALREDVLAGISG